MTAAFEPHGRRGRTALPSDVWATVVDAFGDAVIVTDVDGVVSVWNRAAEQLYGWTFEEALGTNVVDLTVAPEAGVPPATIMDALAAGERWSGEYLVRRKDDSVFVAHVTDVPVRDADGRVTAIVGFSHPVRERQPASPLRLVEVPDAVHILESTLVRPDFPVVPGVTFSAAHVSAESDPGLGGDWYDVFLVPDGSVVLAVGDVSGHGLVAARFMAKMRHATRAYATEMQFDELLPALNRFLGHYASDGLIVTMQLARFDPRGTTIEFANAGHVPPIMSRAGRARVLRVPRNLLLGLAGLASTYDTVTIGWPPGTTVVMYTDGLVERPGELLDDGVQRLADSLLDVRLPATADRLRDAAIAGCLTGVARRDDACILLAMRD